VRVALDATYSIDSHPSGIAVYSRQLLEGLAIAYPEDRFIHCYRPKQFLKSNSSHSSNARRALLVSSWPTFGADIFHALNQRVDRRFARRVVSTFHDLFVMTGDYSSREFRERFTKQARAAAERSELIIAVSEFTANQVTSLLNVEPSRMRVIPHGVITPRVATRRKREEIILFVGALQARKNVTRLVEAFETIPEPWRLVLAGAPTGYKAQEILDRIQASRLRNRIEVTGYVSREKLNELFARSSIFAFPSLDEGFGIPVLEAMASGVPVMTSNRSALADLGRGAALLVDPYSVQNIAAALRDLTENTALREDLRKAGELRAAEFTWERAVRGTYGVYSELR
jgi:glycosyltransferase involved in cell wall biosynthesis